MFRALPRTQALWFVYVIKRTWDGEIDQINLRGPRKGRASHRTTHSAWVRGCSEHLDLFTSVYYIYTNSFKRLQYSNKRIRGMDEKQPIIKNISRLN